jgi:hypothetical protein
MCDMHFYLRCAFVWHRQTVILHANNVGDMFFGYLSLCSERFLFLCETEREYREGTYTACRRGLTGAEPDKREKHAVSLFPDKLHSRNFRKPN